MYAVERRLKPTSLEEVINTKWVRYSQHKDASKLLELFIDDLNRWLIFDRKPLCSTPIEELAICPFVEYEYRLIKYDGK